MRRKAREQRTTQQECEGQRAGTSSASHGLIPANVSRGPWTLRSSFETCFVLLFFRPCKRLRFHACYLACFELPECAPSHSQQVGPRPGIAGLSRRAMTHGVSCRMPAAIGKGHIRGFTLNARSRPFVVIAFYMLSLLAFLSAFIALMRMQEDASEIERLRTHGAVSRAVVTEKKGDTLTRASTGIGLRSASGFSTTSSPINVLIVRFEPHSAISFADLGSRLDAQLCPLHRPQRAMSSLTELLSASCGSTMLSSTAHALVTF
jgi:hypothetical protein